MDQRFVVTGCASGIGQHVAEVLLRRGARVLAADIAIDGLQTWAASQSAMGDRLHIAELDITDVDAWRRTLAAAQDAFGGVDVLMNIAGYLMPGYVHELALEDIDRHMDINAKGVMYGTRLTAEIMIAAGGGHIINIASMAALAPVPGIALYSASKYAVRAFSIAAAVELRKHNVAVTVVCPDPVDTPMLTKQRKRREAALTFSAPRIISLDEITTVLLDRVLQDRPVEVAIPGSRKWLAKVLDLWPGLGRHLVPFFQRQGQAKQATYD